MDSQIRRIKVFAEWYRDRFCVEVTSGTKPELSGEMFGEFRVLLYGQLITTPFGEGAWRELFDGQSPHPAVVEGVLVEVEQFLSSQDASSRDDFERKCRISAVS